MNTEHDQKGGAAETSTEQWNEYVNNREFNHNLLDTLSTPTNTAALEDKLVTLLKMLTKIIEMVSKVDHMVKTIAANKIEAKKAETIKKN